MDNLIVETGKAKADVIELFRKHDESRKTIEDLSWKVAELYTLKKAMEDQKDFVETLHTDFNRFSKHVSGYMEDTDKAMGGVLASCKATEVKIVEIKDYVEHFAENLFLSSSQITVEPACGLASKPMSLTDALKLTTADAKSMDIKTKEHKEQIEEAFKLLEQKAPDSVLVNINILEKKVATIEVHLQKEEEQGLGVRISI